MFVKGLIALMGSTGGNEADFAKAKMLAEILRTRIETPAKAEFPIGSKGAESKFKEVQDAYEILGDKDKKIKFDQEGRSTLKAIAEYTKAIELDPKGADAYYNRGIAYGKLKQYDKAITDYTKAIELDPKGADAYCNRGITYEKLKQYEKAITDYTKAIKYDPKSAYYNSRGNAYRELKQFDKAIADCNKAIEFDKRSPNSVDNELRWWGLAFFLLFMFVKGLIALMGSTGQRSRY